MFGFSSGLAWKELSEIRWKVIVSFLVLAVLGVSLVVLYGYISDLLLTVPLPEVFRDQITWQMADFSRYLYANWYSKNLYQVATVIALIMGMNAVAGEVSRKTISFLLSFPLSRGQMAWTKYLVGLLALWVVIVGATLILLGSAVVAGRTVDTPYLLAGLPASLAGAAFLYSLSFLFSVVTRDGVKALAASGIIALALAVPSWFGRLRELSVFTLMSSATTLVTGQVEWARTLVFLALSLVIYAAAAYKLQREDF